MSDEKKQPQKPQQPNKPQQKRVTIDMPNDLEVTYANLAFITNSPAEMVLDFAQMLPRTPKGKVVSRIVMSPMHAKLLHRALTQNLANYEKKFGEIKIPQQTNIADQFFRFPPQKGEDKE